MDNYAAVSNAKFNDNKTEVFSLNGHWDSLWNAPLQAMQITTFHYQGSALPFRYLGFYLPYNTRQRKSIEDQLLLKVQQQCIIYSQRQLSILGRVTVLNGLILSKVWYTLRLLRPTARFFNALKQTMYQFIWQKKTPRLKRDIIFLPTHVGELNVLDPALQHQILQKRWLNYLISPQVYSSFVLPYMLQHLSLFANASAYPILPLLTPSFRRSAVYDKTLSIWHTIFTTMDHFTGSLLSLDTSPIPLVTTLNLPLHMVLSAPPDHWVHRHPQFPMASMFIFDINHNRLRLRVEGEYSRYRRLCQQLYSDILENRSVSLKAFVWDHVLIAPEAQLVVGYSDLPVLSQVCNTKRWNNYTPRNYRAAYQDYSISNHRVPKTVITHFWHTKMHPNARTVLFRTIHRRIPNQVSIHKYSPTVPALCSYCGLSDDTFRHFVVDCPLKWDVWKQVLHHFFPHVHLSSEMIFGSLRYLHVPRSIRRTHILFTVLGTTHWQLWNSYWTHGNSNPQPVHPSSVTSLVTRIILLIDSLLTYG